MTKSQMIKRIVPLLIGCAIIVAMIWNFGVEELYTSLSKSNPYLLVAGFFIFFAGLYVVRIIRWLILFNKAKRIDACKIMLIGLAINQVAPIGTGDLARAFIAKRRLNISVGETLAPVVIERMLDITFLVAATILFLSLLTTGEGYVWQIIIPILLLLVGYGLLIRPQFLDKLESLLEKLKQRKFFSAKLSFLSLNPFKNAMLEFRGGRTLLIPILLTIAVWGIDIIGQYTLLLAFGVQVPILYLCGIVGTSWLIGVFTFLPGGLGTKDVSFALFLLNTLGISLSIGMSVSLIWRLMSYITLGGGAFASLLSFARAGEKEG